MGVREYRRRENGEVKEKGRRVSGVVLKKFY